MYFCISDAGDYAGDELSGVALLAVIQPCVLGDLFQHDQESIERLICLLFADVKGY